MALWLLTLVHSSGPVIVNICELSKLQLHVVSTESELVGHLDLAGTRTKMSTELSLGDIFLELCTLY